jgi:hypothetical protein
MPKQVQHDSSTEQDFFNGPSVPPFSINANGRCLKMLVRFRFFF